MQLDDQLLGECEVFPHTTYQVDSHASPAIEQKWMCQSHGILQLPRSLFRSVVLPLYLYLPYGSVSKHCDLPIEDAHWLNSELSLRFHLDHIPINHMVRVMYIFLK